MQSEYIVNYDIYNDIGQVHKWGNSCLSVTGNPTSAELAENVRQKAAEESNCLPRQVRIVGMFKL